MGKIRERLTFARIIACVALFFALGGASYAAVSLPKNSVGSPQIKKNAVKTGDIGRKAVKVGKIGPEAVKAGKLAKDAITTNRLRDNAVTGAKVNEATLSTVPSAQTANSIVPPEAWHEVGSPGEPSFQNGWQNQAAKTPAQPQTVAFYMDHEGVVHLKGLAGSGGAGTVVFQLPAGYRPASGTFVTPGTGLARIYGSGSQVAGLDGGVLATEILISLDGITFRAES